MLQTEPSFSIYSSSDGVEEIIGGNEDLEGKELVKRDGIATLGSREFSFGKNAMPLIEEEGKEESLREFKDLGIGSDDGGLNSRPLGFEANGDIEEYYERIIRENPSNAFFLSNYAQLLQSKGDFSGAEDFYIRATLLDPNDGKIQLQYAKLVWGLHHDKDKALTYFKGAARAAPEDSHILAAYASFLWDIDEVEYEEEEESSLSNEDRQVEEFGCQVDHCNTVFVEEKRPFSPPLHLATGLGIDLPGMIGSVDCVAADYGDSTNVEDYYKRMIEENPSNVLILRNYAQFLCESRGDLEAAEEYYLRAIQVDPTDAEIIIQYAQLIWQLRLDRHEALPYFKQAVEAAPENCHILAAYASFLWDIDEDEYEEEEESSLSNEDRQVEEFGCQVDHCNTVFVEDKRPASPPLHLATGLGIDFPGLGGMIGSVDCVAADYGDSTNVEDYYKRMIEENPSNVLILRNYAQFLCESRGDLEAAEKYYLRAIQVDPTDGEIIIQYAQLIWQLRLDRHEALPYFKQAVEAAPENSNVLAAYARFLWETEEDDEEDVTGWDDKNHEPVPQVTETAANV